MESPAQSEGKRQCVACGRSMQWDANVCPYCGRDYRQPIPASTPPPKPKTAIPIIGGILLIIAALIGVVQAIMVMTLSYEFLALIPEIAGFEDFIAGLILVIGLIGLVISVLALLGGYFALIRRHLGIAIFGSIMAIFILSPYLIASILGVVGLILIAVSHAEFD